MGKLNDFEKLIVFSIASNTVAIVASLSIFKSSSVLLVFYTFSFLIEVFYYLKIKPVVHRGSFLTAGLFLVVLSLPIVRNQLCGISVDLYDIISMPIKTLNFLILYDLYKNNNETGKESIKFISRVIIIIGVLSCIYNYLFCAKDVLGILSAQSSYEIDIKSFFHNRNTFGEYMYYSLISTYLYFGDKRSKAKSILIILFSVTSFITLSRSAVFSVLMLIVYMSVKSVGVKKYVLLTISTIAAIGIISSPYMNRIENILIRKDNFSTGRSEMWKYGIEEFKKSPLIGSGFYTSIVAAQDKGASHTQYHSFFIDNLAGYGIIGTSFIIILLCSLFVGNISRLRGEKNEFNRKIVTAMYLALIVKMMIESVSFFSIGYADVMATIMYITIPLIMSNTKITDIKNEKNH